MRPGLENRSFSVGFTLSLFAILRVDGDDLYDDSIALSKIIRLNTEHARHDLARASICDSAASLDTEVVIFVETSIRAHDFDSVFIAHHVCWVSPFNDYIFVNIRRRWNQLHQLVSRICIPVEDTELCIHVLTNVFLRKEKVVVHVILSPVEGAIVVQVQVNVILSERIVVREVPVSEVEAEVIIRKLLVGRLVDVVVLLVISNPVLWSVNVRDIRASN